MFCKSGYLGCARGVDDLRCINDRLNAEVVEQINESQELMMINSFARESNEYQFKTCIQERISDIASWRWVFEDLSKRLHEAIEALKYEHNALRVVVERIVGEIEDHSSDASRPGALCPMTDPVEKAILEVRGARVRLSIIAQSHAAKVDAAIRRRLHVNTSKLEELYWQREEAIKDIKSLEEEQITTEKNLLETMKQENLVAARIADRTLRPPGELTKDEVDRRLRNELGRLRHFMKHLRSNLDRINSLQNHLVESIARMDCYAEDISQVVRLDQDRMRLRLDEDNKSDSQTSTAPTPSNGKRSSSHSRSEIPLTAIVEEDEDDYPFGD
ncbi:unnamed protein product [Diatraea saccharalis]|uniref:Tektin n=1 Tax=Diatraea saccharalis TaxID=40085 RepID=A0A9N9QT59_9NEOP|nr:unnamed protein product [Diatraea saccharalis]